MGYEADTIEDWFDDMVSELPAHALLDLLERCLADLDADAPTLH